MKTNMVIIRYLLILSDNKKQGDKPIYALPELPQIVRTAQKNHPMQGYEIFKQHTGTEIPSVSVLF